MSNSSKSYTVSRTFAFTIDLGTRVVPGNSFDEPQSFSESIEVILSRHPQSKAIRVSESIIRVASDLATDAPFSGLEDKSVLASQLMSHVQEDILAIECKHTVVQKGLSTAFSLKVARAPDDF